MDVGINDGACGLVQLPFSMLERGLELVADVFNGLIIG